MVILVFFIGTISISDTIKEGAEGAMKAVKSVGVSKIVMLTGDDKDVAKDVCSKLNKTGRI